MNEGGIGPYGPVVTTSLFHGENEGSSPSGGTKTKDYRSGIFYQVIRICQVLLLVYSEETFYFISNVIFDFK